MTERNTNWTALCKDAPKTFLNNSNMLLSYDYPPPDALCGGMLSLQIWDTFQKNRLDTKSFAIRINSWQDLNTYFLVIIAIIYTQFCYYIIFILFEVTGTRPK